MNGLEIGTARLRLRPVTGEDIDVLHRLWTEPGVRKHLFDDETIARERAAGEVERSQEAFRSSCGGLWTVGLHGDSSLAGFCGYRFFHDPPELQLLYGLTTSLWGRGLATEAARAMIRYGFETCGLPRVVASADAPNIASLRVMEKAGLAFEKRVMIGALDAIYYALAREAYVAGAAPYALRAGP